MHFDINPVALSIGSLEIRWYGLMYVVGFLIGWWLGRRRAVQNGWKERDIDDFVVIGKDNVLTEKLGETDCRGSE